MNEELISQYIDNELDLVEKIVFVKTVHESRQYTEEAVALLHQEQRLRTAPGMGIAGVPLALSPSPAKQRPRWFWPVAWTGLAATMAALLLLVGQHPAPQSPLIESRRFVLYLPEVERASLVGTFTGWRPVDMERIGGSGYWTLTLQMPAGEHRYSILVDNSRLMADPTVGTREQDDFGGENSVIEVRTSI